MFIGPSATLTNDRYPPSGGNWNPVVVEDKVVIGANATSLRCHPPFRLHNCSRSGGNKDVPANELWAGNPAKFLMTRDEYE